MTFLSIMLRKLWKAGLSNSWEFAPNFCFLWLDPGNKDVRNNSEYQLLWPDILVIITEIIPLGNTWND